MSTKRVTKRGAPVRRRTRPARGKTPPRIAPSTAAAEAGSPLPRPGLSFPIVGVGASAGGLEAFAHLLQSLPRDTGMGIVLVQHLDPGHASALTELLSRVSPVPVCEVTNGMAVEPNRVHVIPPNVTMSISRGRLRLQPRSAVPGPHRSIDVFLESLAQDQKSQAIGVILSGTATDGTLGLEAIKAEGGITFAQDEKSARYDSMPHSAIACGCVDFVLAPQQIAEELGRLSRHSFVIPASAPAPQPTVAPPDLEKILGLLSQRVRIDFSSYKANTIYRRIHRRMALSKTGTLADYLNLLRDQPAEIETLCQDFLINVTSFFRDPAAYRALKARVFPRIGRQSAPDYPIRIWVVGCSTGQEAYSIAMAFLEYAEEKRRTYPLQIFATDVSEEALERARSGFFPKALATEVGPDRLRRFFAEAEGGYRISKTIRERCLFAKQNVLSDPPFSRMDLISCRNLLIYLQPDVQKKLMPMFHYALKPGGYLWLGAAEGAGAFGHLFAPQDKVHRIYSKKPSMIRQAFSFTHAGPSGSAAAPSKKGAVETGIREPLDGQREADRLLLARYAPVGVLVNADMDVLQFRGDTGPYLKPPQGRPSLSLLKMLREGLMLPVRAALQRAKRQRAPVRKEAVPVEQNGGTSLVNVEVVPLRNLPRDEKQFLVIFEPGEKAPPAGLGARMPTAGAGARAPSGRVPSRRRPASPPPADQEPRLERKPGSERIRLLERELADTKDYLQAVVEQHEAANEELQSAGEEAQSSNEELQSVNEELETSKEELQATNEELITVNEELQNRNREIGQLNNDLLNLLNSVSIPILMLGPDLRIRRLTPITEPALQILPTDVGRPIGDLKLSGDIPGLERVITDVIDTVTPRELEVMGPEGRWYSLRIRPYKTLENKIEGAVVALLDVDALKRSEQQNKEGREYAQALVDTVRESLLLLDGRLTVQAANRSYYQTFQMTPAETEGRCIYELAGGQWNIPRLRSLLEEVLPGDQVVDTFEVDHTFPRLGRRILLLNARRIRREGGGRELTLLAIEDVTERRQAELALSASEIRFRRLFETARDGVLILDPETRRILDSNPLMSELLGYAREELRGRTLGEIGAFDDAAAGQAAIERLLASGYLRQENLSIRTRAGEHREVELVGNLYQEGDHRVIQCTVRDMTEHRLAAQALRASEERLRLANETAGVATYEIDFEANLTHYSPEMGVLLGTTLPEAEPAGSDVRFVHLEDREEWARQLAALKDPAGDGVVRSVFRMTRPNGEVRWMSLIGCAYFRDTPAGRIPMRAIGTIQDVTERKLLEDRLAHAQKMEAIGLLASGIAHDFNNLLVGVIGNASLLEDMLAQDSEAQQFLGRIITAGQHASFLTRQLLAYAGKGPIALEPLDLSPLIRDGLDLLRSTIPNKIDLRLTLGEDLPLIKADRSQVEQVFMNLVLNASEAIGADAGSISITTGVREVEAVATDHDTALDPRPGRYVYLEVTDTGCGMNEETRARIFDPFFTTKFLGRGLGLAAVSGIVRGHGGSIGVSSSVGRGSRFTVLFPAIDVEAPQRDVRSLPARDLRGAGTVLVVDDEEIVRNMARATLERFGYQVLLAESGPLGVERFREAAERIALVVLDLSMPGMGGTEVLPELLRTRPDAKVLISSGYSETDAMNVFHDAHVSGFIQKPYTAAQLAEKVKQAID